MTGSDSHTLTALEALRRIREGLLTSVDLIRSCLARIDETDAQIWAWAHIDRERALARAEQMDAVA